MGKVILLVFFMAAVARCQYSPPSGGGGGGTSYTFQAPISAPGNVVQIPLGDTTHNGYISSTAYTSFVNKASTSGGDLNVMSQVIGIGGVALSSLGTGLYKFTNGVPSLATPGTDYLKLDGSGNLTIGTTVPGGAPASSLAVLGNIYGASGLFTPVVNSFASQISGGSITGSSTSGFGVSVTGTLNTTGVVDGAVLFSNITNTASNPQSTLIDLQSGGVSYLAFSLGNNGRLSVGNTALQVGELLLGSTGAANGFANALGVLTAQNGYLLIKSEPAGSSGLNEPGIQLLASNGTDVGSIIAAYGSGFGGGNTTANSAFYLLNTTSNSNTNYDVMDTRLTPSLNVTGCTGATLATDSSNWTGSITGLPTGACTIVLTFAVSSGQGSGVAHHAWTCAVSDNTTANLFRVSASSTSSVTFSGVSVSGDVLSYGPCGGY